MNENRKKGGAISRFFEEKGFYIILFLCIAAIGIAGYVLFIAPDTNDPENIAMPSSISSSEYEDHSVSRLPALHTQEDDEYTPSVPSVYDDSEISSTLPVASSDPDPEKDDLDSAPAVSSAAVVETVKPAEKKQEKAKTEKTEEKTADFFVKPVAGDVIREFCVTELIFDRTMGDWRTHNGADYSASIGETISAIADGEVHEVYNNEFYGTVVVIGHGSEIESFYYGLAQEATVKPGDSVKAGDTIGSVASQCHFEALEPVHLHLEMKKSGKFVNPSDYIK